MFFSFQYLCELTLVDGEAFLKYFPSTIAATSVVLALHTLGLASWVGCNLLYYIDTDEIPGFFCLLKNHIFIARSEDTIFIFHV